jgi:hypothetical protein
MPSTSKAQHNLMAARAHGAKFPMARKIPLKVAKEFSDADRGKHFRNGGGLRGSFATGGASVNIFPLPSGDISPIAASDAISSTNMYPGIASQPGATQLASPQINTNNIVASVPVGGSSGAPTSPYMTSLPLSSLTGGGNTTIAGTPPPATLGAATGTPAAANSTAAPAATPAPINVTGNVGNSPFSVSVPASGSFQATGPNNTVINFAGANANSPTITGTGANNVPVTINNPFYKAAAARGGRQGYAFGGPMGMGDLGIAGMGGLETSSLFNSLFGGKGNFFDELFGIGGGSSSSTSSGGSSSGGGGALSTLGDIASIASFFFNQGGHVNKAHGGGLAHCYDMGGSMPSEPFYVRSDAREMDGIPHTSGLFNSAGAGRTDILNRDVPAGGYVVPADVVAGLGEGNTMAGANVIQKMMSTGPYGTPLPRGQSRGPRIPSPPHEYREPHAGGGRSEAVPVKTAGGEFFIHPEDIQAKFGDLDRGHKILDAWVLHERKKHIKTLQKLPGPKK